MNPRCRYLCHNLSMDYAASNLFRVWLLLRFADVQDDAPILMILILWLWGKVTMANIIWDFLGSAIGFGCSFYGRSIFRALRDRKRRVQCAPEHTSQAETFLRPMIFPCRTSHTRLFPKKHSFSYSYLLVGIPVGWHGSRGSMISADTELENCSIRKKAWFDIDSKDYLERGASAGGFRGKLKEYLESQV